VQQTNDLLPGYENDEHLQHFAKNNLHPQNYILRGPV
jgi:hypothetical protein